MCVCLLFMSKHIIQLCTCMYAQLHMHIISLYLSEGEEQGKRERESGKKENASMNIQRQLCLYCLHVNKE